MSSKHWNLGHDDTHVSRRDFLRLSVTGVATVAAGGNHLSRCATGPATAPSTADRSSLKPRHGGTLRAGFSGGSSSDTLNPLSQISTLGSCYAQQLFDGLVTYDADAQLQLALASEVTPNSDATVWTIRLKPGVTFHDGRDLTADDVIYTLQEITNPKNPQPAAALLTTLVRSSLTKLDRLTVRARFSAPNSAFAECLCNYMGIPVIPVDFDPRKPVGTGPFTYDSFTPGIQATFVRNDNYWQHRLPYVDKLLISDVSDETTQVNGLISGQYHIVDNLSAASINAVESGGASVLISEGASWNPFTMRVDRAPFSDVRVRQAFRLLVDRTQLRNLVFDGHGLIGNDLYAPFDPVYDHQLPQRHQDIPQARHLLKQAGYDDLTVTLVTSDFAQGVVQEATVLAQQATAAGVTVKVANVPTSTFFGPNYLQWVFAQDLWFYNPYFLQVVYSDLPTASFNEPHYRNKAYYTLYYKAMATTHAHTRKELAYEMQRMYWDDSGYIIPVFSPNFDGYTKEVHGLTKSRIGFPFNIYSLKSLWLE